MFRYLFLFPFLAAALSGCARTAPQPQISDADCRHVVSPDGREVRFCETGSRVTMERGPAVAMAPPSARLIDDPEFLAAMIDRLPREAGESKKSAKADARICSAGAPGYITIRESDFAKMVHAPAPIPAGARTAASAPEPKQSLASVE